MARECSTRGGLTTETVRTGRADSLASGAVGPGPSVAALPTEENSPVATQMAVPIATAIAANLWNLNLAIRFVRSTGRSLLISSGWRYRSALLAHQGRSPIAGRRVSTIFLHRT